MTPITSLFSGLIKRDPFAIYKEDISKSTFVTCAEKNVRFSAYDQLFYFEQYQVFIQFQVALSQHKAI